MGKLPEHSDSATRSHLLQAALKCFARCGYAAASVQDIVDAAQVSKPVLYYYFTDKARLFQALVDQAHDERYRLMQEAAVGGHTVREKLEALVASLFEFALQNRELVRLAFASAFAGPGEAPGGLRCREKGRRNYEFVRDLIQEGQTNGELDPAFTADELTMGIYGQVTHYSMLALLVPDFPLTPQAAKQTVRLFFQGAAHSRGGVSEERRALRPETQRRSAEAPLRKG